MKMLCQSSGATVGYVVGADGVIKGYTNLILLSGDGLFFD